MNDEVHVFLLAALAIILLLTGLEIRDIIKEVRRKQ